MGLIDYWKRRQLRWLDEVPDDVPSAARDGYLAARRRAFEEFSKAVDADTARRFVTAAENRTKRAQTEERAKSIATEYARELRFTPNETDLLVEFVLARRGGEK